MKLIQYNLISSEAAKVAPQAFLLEPQWFPMKWEVVNLKQKWMGQFIFPIKQQHPVMLLMSKAICGYKHVRKLWRPHNNILNSLPRNKFFKISISLTYLSCTILVFATLAYFLLIFVLKLLQPPVNTMVCLSETEYLLSPLCVGY